MLLLVVKTIGVVAAFYLVAVAILRHRPDDQIDGLIGAKGAIPKFGKLSPAESEALRQMAERRRDHATAKRVEAARIESGAESPERMRLVGRR